ncbi:MAG: hypothetical protein FWH03_07445 [Firmicutes bacterium]|nr:hypothetical protein [Bacillota bacterium]
MKKFVTIALCCILAAGLFAACSGGANRRGDSIEINVLAVDGAPLLTIAKMASDGFAVEDGYAIRYNPPVLGSDALIASLLKQEPDFAIAPTNIAALMHANSSGYRLAGVAIWGIMHIVSNQSISSPDELKGETVFAYARSGTPGITLRTVLEKSGIKFTENQPANYTVPADTVHIVYLSEPSDVRNAIIAGSIGGRTVKFGLLAEPVVTAIAGATASLPHGQFTAKISLQTEWAKHTDGQNYPQAALIFHERLLKNDAALVDKFIALAELSTLYAKHNPKSAGDLAVSALKSSAIPNGTLVEAAVNAGRIPLDFTRAAQAKPAVQAYLQIIYDNAPNLVGGKMPAENFYYNDN